MPESDPPPDPTRTTARAAASLAALSAWLVLLFAGWAGAGAVHLLLLVAVVLFPWRAAIDRGGGIDGLTEPEDDRP